MAIKERKQITGTTAQIQAYAGHEGQIVWDKDKKTFVGMSGTAGKNYPLAQQAYVDNEIEKINTEGLAGKEDKGVCLPLTGGNLTGELMFNALASIYQQNIPEYEEIMFQSYDRANQWTGGLLTCRGHSGSVEAERGSFLLGARHKDGSGSSYLLGTPAGNLLWEGNEVLRVTGSGPGWVRFYPNLQICFGEALTTSEGSATVSYGAPFSSILSVTATILGDSYAAGVNWGIVTNRTSGSIFKAYAFRNGVSQPTIYFSWCAFGYY